MNKFVFIFMLISTLGFTQSSNPKVLKIDTIMLLKSIKFSSDIKEKIANCFDQDFYETDSFTLKDAKNTISLFNKELHTSVFHSIKAITGVSIKTELSENWMTIMEWHFQDEKASKKVNSHLEKLDKGIIRHTIVPAACFWIQKGKKIYVILFGPRKGDNKKVEDFFTCLKASPN